MLYTNDNVSFEPLRRAVAQLSSALIYAEEAAGRSDTELFSHVRAGAIQAFEFTYELSISTLRRYLALIEPSSISIGRLSFQELIRLGYANGLVRDELSVWAAFREARNRTSHSYSEQSAQALYLELPAFAACVTTLLHDLERHAATRQ